MIAGITEIVHVLLDKGIPFCVYRIPENQNYNWAFPKEILPHPVNKYFCLTPFTKKSKAPEITLGILETGYMTPAFIETLKSLPNNIIQDVQLPLNTDFGVYSKQFERIQQFIHDGEISKAILSRVVIQDKPDDFDAAHILETLCEDYPNTFAYLIVHPSSGIWMGASPELLIESDSERLKIMAVAGTQKRKTDGLYHWRSKEMDEHYIVGHHIEEVFTANAGSLLCKSGPNTVEAGRVVHLRTDYEYKMEKTDVMELVSQIHPTPAIGGYPVEKSVEIIYDVEDYDRSYYCGYLGETDYKSLANLYVNLRCMQIGKDNIAIYAGGGITSESDLQEEWEETELKSKTMADVLKSKVAL